MIRQELHPTSNGKGFNKRKLIGDQRFSSKDEKSGVKIIGLCSYCKKFRGNDGDWYPLYELKVKSSDLRFSHGICPACAEALYPDLYKAIRLKRALK